MLHPSWFLDELQKYRITFFSGVPDSLLKDFCLYVAENVSSQQHIITANEGSAVALATGHHLVTGDIGLVYLQNSGIGNAVNPLVSLADPAVYSIPMLLIIGWRGEPGVHDEPQHIKQGMITIKLLDTLGIPYRLLPKERSEAQKEIRELMEIVHTDNRPCALVVQKGVFEKHKSRNSFSSPENLILSREQVVIEIGKMLQPRDIVVSTTGMTSRELFEYRVNAGQVELGQDFLTVGSMGHASQIALGIALQKQDRMVYCIDGDGAFIMHMGGAAIIGSQSVPNLKHIIINNGSHDSVGGQPTVAQLIDIPGIAQACGYKEVKQVSTLASLFDALKWLRNSHGPSLLEVLVKKGARADLGRPTITPQQNKQYFMKHCSK